jgi:hypothetical protein
MKAPGASHRTRLAVVALRAVARHGTERPWLLFLLQLDEQLNALA